MQRNVWLNLDLTGNMTKKKHAQSCFSYSLMHRGVIAIAASMYQQLEVYLHGATSDDFYI